MTKTFCDICQSEINKSNELNMFVEGQGVYVEQTERIKFPIYVKIQAGFPADEKPRDICRYCVFDAVGRLDDRPRCA